jgi:hypothetical protein
MPVKRRKKKPSSTTRYEGKRVVRELGDILFVESQDNVPDVSTSNELPSLEKARANP